MRNFKLFLFFTCRAVGLFRLAQFATRHRLRILCYHGFALEDESAFRPKLFLAADVFEKRMEAIRRYGLQVLPLNEAIERLYSGSLPSNAAVITVDDGFDSFHRVAVPCLKKYGYPASVYVTTYYVQNPNPIFRLVVQYMFWKTQRRELILKDVPWSDDAAVDLTDPAQKERATWKCIDYGEQQCTEEERCAICEQLGALLGVPYDAILRSRTLHLMTPEQLRSLAAAHIDVELHTHRHTFPQDNENVAEREIADNRAALKQLLSIEARHFCYPSGEWDERQWSWLDRMGIRSSTTCVPGLNSHKTPRHALRRFLDGQNIHQLEFEAALSGFSDLLRGSRV